MKKVILLHYGFKPPTSDIMAAWGNWFDVVKDSVIYMGGHFPNGQEITQNGIKTLPRNSKFLPAIQLYQQNIWMKQRN